MLSQLDGKIAGMRAQFMTFNNNGIEFQLSVPDTNDVKSTLGSFVTTIVEQKTTIDGLNHDMAKMAKDHDNSIASIMAWATQCIVDLKNQNEAIENQLRDAVSKLNNFSYNMQGYADKDDVIQEVEDMKMPTAPSSGQVSVLHSRYASRAPSRTHAELEIAPAPKPASSEPTPAIEPIAETQDEADAPSVKSSARPAEAPVLAEPAPVDEKPVVFFPTEKQHHDDDASAAERAQQQQEGGDSVGELTPHSNAKPKARRRTNSLLYLSTPSAKMPKSARGRWLWAFNTVRKMLRMRTNKISLTRTRVVKGQSVLDRLERLEQELFQVNNELSQVNAARKEELAMLDKLMNPPKPPTPEPEAEVEEVAPEPEPVPLRVVDSVHCDKLKSRVDKLVDKLSQIRESMESLDKICPYLIDQSKHFQDPKTHTDGDHLQSYLKLDSEIKTARSELRMCESNSFLLEELVSNMDHAVKDVTQFTDYDEPSAEVVKTLAEGMEALALMMDHVRVDIAKAVDLMFLHSNTFAENWKQFIHYMESAPSNASLMQSIDLLNISVRETKEHVFDMDERLIKVEESDIMNPPPPVIEEKDEDADNPNLPENWSEKLMPFVKDMIDAYLEAANIGTNVKTPRGAARASSRQSSRQSNRARSVRSASGDFTEEGEEPQDEVAGGDVDGGNEFNENVDGDDGNNEDGSGNAGNVSSKVVVAGEEADIMDEDMVLERHGMLSPQLAAEAAAKKAKAEELKLKMVNKKKDAAAAAQQEAEEKAKADADAKAAAAAAKKAEKLAYQQQLQLQAQQYATRGQTEMVQHPHAQPPSEASSQKQDGGGANAPSEVQNDDIGPMSRGNSLTKEDSKQAQAATKPQAKSHKKKLISAAPERGSPDDIEGISMLSQSVGDMSMSNSSLAISDDLNEDNDGAGNGMNDVSLMVTKIKPKTKKEQQGIRDMLNKQRSGMSSNSGVAMSVSGKEINVGTEIALIVRKMEEMYQDKLDTEKGLELLASKANAFDLDNKVDIDMFEAVERSLQSITREIGDLRKCQRLELDKVRSNLQKSIMKALGNIMAQRESSVEPGVSALSTKALCLNCGRESIARTVPSSHYQAAQFPNVLVSHSSPGSDVMRGGFKLPVTKQFNPLMATASQILENNDEEANDGEANKTGGLGADGEVGIVDSISTELGPLSPNQSNRNLLRSAGMWAIFNFGVFVVYATYSLNN
jgi:hypothetical protein